MNEDFNTLVSRLSTPIWDIIGNRSYILVANNKGKILKFWNKKTFIHQSDIIRPIEESGSLFEYFDFKGIADLSVLSRTTHTFHGKFDRFSHTILEGFTTLLPIVNLRISPVDNTLFIGAIQVSNTIPNIYNPDGGAMIFVDEKDNLVGFNDNFSKYFKGSFSQHHQALGKPCAEFLSPSPAEIQDQYFKKILQQPTSFPEPVIVLGGNKKNWENSSVAIVFQLLSLSVNTFKQDFRVDVEFTAGKGNYPLLLLGDTLDTNLIPDTFGYTISTSVETGMISLKKYGHVVSRSTLPVPDTETTIRYQWTKLGKAFLLAVNGQELLRFYDFDLLEKQEAHILIGLRPENQLCIQKIALSIRPSNPPVKHEDTIVRLHTPNKPFFAINRFYNNSLSNQTPLVNGYMLRDITALKQDVERLRGLLSQNHGAGEVFLGDSATILKIREKAAIVANSNATLLIQGETGTGKEVLAGYIHSHSPYSKGPFLKVDCSTLAPTLIESELFGHEKGAFTGAMQDKKGKFEQAQGGTLFLDEVNNLGPDVQAKLLNVLQDFTITRIGGQKIIRLDMRIIIASNIRLDEMVRRGMFRQDLYFRINVITLELPPLRERKDDIPQLCEYFLATFNVQHRKDITGITPDAFRKLSAYSWPGNIRELRNVIYRAVIYCEGQSIDDSLIQLQDTESAHYSTFKNTHISKVPSPKRLGDSGRELMLTELSRHHGNVRRAAEALGLSRQSFYYNCRKYSLDVNDIRKQKKKSF